MQRRVSAERRGAAAWAGANAPASGRQARPVSLGRDGEGRVRAVRTICQWQIVKRERPACRRRAGWQARPVPLGRDGEGEGKVGRPPLSSASPVCFRRHARRAASGSTPVPSGPERKRRADGTVGPGTPQGRGCLGGRERACRGVRAARTICQWQIVRPERPARKRRAGWQARPVSLGRDGEGKRREGKGRGDFASGQIVRRERPACRRRAGWQARPVPLGRDGEEGCTPPPAPALFNRPAASIRLPPIPPERQPHV
jgi:hypothetical protein